MANDSLGGFELQMLLAVMLLGEDAYGVSIADTIGEAIGREISIGSVYVTLDGLEERGLVTSRLGESTPDRGGRAKRYFQVTDTGLRAVHRTPGRGWSGVPVLREGTA